MSSYRLVLFLFLVSFSSYNANAFALTKTTGRAVWTHPIAFPRASTRLHSASAFDADNDTPDPIASVKTLDEIVPRSTIRQLSKKSNYQGLLQVLFVAAVWALSAAIPQATLSLLATAFVSSFFFHGLHETVHGTAFASPYLNRVFRHLFGFLTMRPARHYFYYHWQHHKHTGNPELDSELQTGSSLDMQVNNLPTYLLYLSGIPFWIDALVGIFRHAAGNCDEVYLSNRNHAAEVTREARCYLALYTIIAVVMWKNSNIHSLLLRYWILPALLGQPFLRFYLAAEHRGMAISDNVLENTRTVATKNWLVRRLAWCMPYHKEHHAWPSVPFWNLHRVYELQPPEARASRGADSLYNDGPEECQSYVAFNWRFLRKILQ